MIKTLIGFVTGVLVALSSAAVAGDDQAEPETRCHAWSDPNTMQCNVYFPDVKRVRVKVYVGGEYGLGVDYWPGWEAPAKIIHERKAH